MTAVAALLDRIFSPKQAGGPGRLAALGFFVLALAGGVIAALEPQASRWAGAVLAAAIGACAIVLLLSVARGRARVTDALRRAASAAAVSNAAWVVTGKNGEVLQCNSAYRDIAGGRDGRHALPPQLAFPGDEPAAALYRMTRAATSRLKREETFETVTGQRISASVRGFRSGEAAWWFTPRFTNAAPVKQAALEKRASSGLIRFADFFRNAPIGVASTTADGKVTEANGPFADFFGLGAFAAGARFGDLIAPTERATALGRIAEAANGEIGHEPVEIRSLSAVERSAQLFASAFMANADGTPQAILYLVDTSEQKALETQFAQSQKMQAIGQLAGGVAHDFNNLLQAIIGNCDLLLMRHPAGDPAFAEINEVRQNSVRAAGLVRQLLAFSRQQTLQPKVLALADTLGELSMLLRRLLGERINLRFEHAQNLWPVRADEGQISNAIMNLAVNARDAMPPQGGSVTIRTSNITQTAARPVSTAMMPAGDYVLIEVIDTGAGIARENLDKIFEPFFTTKPVGQGTGLGLSTVYGVVKQTGGFIIVESELERGTAFQIYLPRYIVAENTVGIAAEEREPAASRDVTGQDTILLVEDEDAVRSFAARALKMRGYTVMDANGGEAALEIVRNYEGAIDLLITDVVMPNMDGPTLVRAATRLRPEMRVIFMSGYAEDAFRRNEEKAEELHFLPKPFGLKQLVAKVKEVLSGAPPAKLTDALNDTGT